MIFKGPGAPYSGTPLGTCDQEDLTGRVELKEYELIGDTMSLWRAFSGGGVQVILGGQQSMGLEVLRRTGIGGPWQQKVGGGM